MSWKRISAVSLLAATATWSTFGIAQDYRSQQAAAERDIATLNQQVSAKEQQINALRARPSPEQADLSEAKKALDDARAALKATPTAEAEGKAKNAEFKLKLAEIKYNKAHGDVQELVDEVDKLKQQVASKQLQLKDLSKLAAEQAASGDAQQQKLADEKAKRQQQDQELQRSKQQAEAAQKEIERLKAALAAKEAAATKAAPAVEPAKPAAPIETPKVEAPKVVEAPKTEAPKVEAAKVEPPKAEPQKVEAPKPEAPKPAATAGVGIIRLLTQQEVIQELQQLEQRVAQNKTNGGANEALYLKKPNTVASNKDKVTLRLLGNEQFRGHIVVEPGQYQATIGFNQWPVEFSDSDRGDTVFIYDNSDNKKPRLIFYSSALEGGK